MKCEKISKKQKMSMSGKKILKMLMADDTPLIDLLVRESIQNSADAIKKDADHGIIKYLHGQFDNKNVLKYVGEFAPKLAEMKKDNEYDFLAIMDSNTTGLLGGAWPTEDGPNNFYNLVYDIMNGKEEEGTGGSWGLGKTVYYKFGIGLCFYYTRTFEDGKYIEKLAGDLIQDSEAKDSLFEKGECGIAFLGDLDETNSAIPIYDQQYIHDFLSTFGIHPFEEKETGTIVIIPYFNTNRLLENSVNNDVERDWKNDFLGSMKIAVQRWYFPRLNNDLYKGKYIKVGINNVLVTLNPFFQMLQNLYNDLEPDSTKFAIELKKPKIKYGELIYKKISKNDSVFKKYKPCHYLDLNSEPEKENIIFYTRKPGMIVTYDDEKMNPNIPCKEEYLIGIFKLADDETLNLGDTSEKVGEYIKKTENADHKKWSDSNVPSMPNLTKFRPYYHIWNETKKELKAKILPVETIEGKDTDINLSIKYGKMLPAFGPGNAPTGTKPDGTKEGVIRSLKKCDDKFVGYDNGFILYETTATLDGGKFLKTDLYIKASKRYNWKEWENEKFTSPCRLVKIDIVYIKLNDDTVISNKSIEILKKDSAVDLGYADINKLWLQYQKGIDENINGVILENNLNKKLNIKMKFYLLPIDFTYSIDLTSTLCKIEKGEKTNEKY